MFCILQWWWSKFLLSQLRTVILLFQGWYHLPTKQGIPPWIAVTPLHCGLMISQFGTGSSAFHFVPVSNENSTLCLLQNLVILSSTIWGTLSFFLSSHFIYPVSWRVESYQLLHYRSMSDFVNHTFGYGIFVFLQQCALFVTTMTYSKHKRQKQIMQTMLLSFILN